MAKNSKEKQKQYDAKRAGRTRNFTVVLYPENLPEDWREKIDETHVKWIESPLHDKDLNPDGQPKKPHYHAIFMFDSVKTLEQVSNYFKKIFGESENESIIGVAAPQTVSDRCALVRYFAHLDHPSKAQYEVSDIIGHNGADPAEILRYSATETREMIVAMEEFIEQNGIIELADFAAAIRYDNPEWHTLLSTKMTVYFTAFIRSRRHKVQAILKQVDETTGEIIEE